MLNDAELLEFYRKSGNFYETCKVSNLPARIVHFKLLKAGILKINDKIQYGNKFAKFGAEAEQLFQKLVPGAIDANRCWRLNNPVFDFDYKGLKIEIKYSSKRNRGNCNAHWYFSLKEKCDLTVAFLEAEKGKRLSSYHILIVPHGLKATGSMYITEGSEKFRDFNVGIDELVDVLDEYVEVFNNNKED